MSYRPFGGEITRGPAVERIEGTKFDSTGFHARAQKENMKIENKILYHGSRISGLKVLKPRPHNVVKGRSVVFATPDIRFALAMIYGTGDELAVGYFEDAKTREEEMVINELQSGRLQLLNAPGYLYEVEGAGFYYDSALCHVELIKDTEANILKEIEIPNVLDELKKYSITITKYKDVPGNVEFQIFFVHYWKHAALNFGQAMRDLRYFFDEPNSKNIWTAMIRRTGRFLNNIIFTILPPQFHHSSEELREFDKASAKRWYLHGYKPWDYKI